MGHTSPPEEAGSPSPRRAGRGRRPPLVGRRREPVRARVRGYLRVWLLRPRPLTPGCRLVAPTTGSSRPSPRVRGRGNARRPSGQAGIGHVPIWKRLVPLSPWAGRGRRPPLAGRRREPVRARVRGYLRVWRLRPRALTLGCRLAAPTMGSSRPSPRVRGEGNARRPSGLAGIRHVPIWKRRFPSPRGRGEDVVLPLPGGDVSPSGRG